MIEIERVNTILYCRRWPETVAFYRDSLGLSVEYSNDWFVEFAVGSGAFVSVADAARTSIPAGDGAGVTMSWRVADVAAVRSALLDMGVDIGDVRMRWGANAVDVHDPAGNRIEFWSDAPQRDA